MNSTQNSLLSEIVRTLKYAKFLPELRRRETWKETVERNITMHVRKYPFLEEEIRKAYQGVFKYHYLPSMRSMQFGLEAAEKNNTRIYNCAYVPVVDIDTFGEIMFILLSGCGVGFSVRKYHVSRLPKIKVPEAYETYAIADSIEGWADAIKKLMHGFLGSGVRPIFDYSLIRPEGSKLKTSGGRAPGPEPLRRSLEAIEGVLASKFDGAELSPLDCHDIICMLSRAVSSGGIRRSALLSLFSEDDHEILSAKGTHRWWEDPRGKFRSGSNNSVCFFRDRVTKKDFDRIWDEVKASGAGEPGIYFLGTEGDGGVNPCNEAYLEPYQFCNLTEINVNDVDTQEELEHRARCAAFIGTIQAGYTDFTYLRPIWKRTTERDALLGVGMTGVGSGKVLSLDLRKAARVVKEENERVASLIGINKAARTTLIKPSGTCSLLLNTSSGIHGWHAPFYIRRIRLWKVEPVYSYFKEKAPQLVEDDLVVPGGAVISLPVRAPKNCIYKTDDVFQFLERIKRFNQEWVAEGHRYGGNTHNVSATVTVKSDEWDAVGEWMWENRYHYNGLSLMPEDGIYKQMPFEATTEDQIIEMESMLEGIDISEIREDDDLVNFMEASACEGDKCEITK